MPTYPTGLGAFVKPGIQPPGLRRGPDIPAHPAALVPPGTPGAAHSASPPTTIRDPHHRAVIVEANVNVPAAGAQSTRVVVQGAGTRNYLAIRNSDAVATLLLSFGREASSTSTHALPPKGLVIWDQAVPQGDIYVLSDGLASAAGIAYSEI